MFLADIAAVVPMSAEVKEMVTTAINAGSSAIAIAALLGGGGVITYIVKQAFKKGATKVIVAA